jgi:hypothetical protein
MTDLFRLILVFLAKVSIRGAFGASRPRLPVPAEGRKLPGFTGIIAPERKPCSLLLERACAPRLFVRLALCSGAETAEWRALRWICTASGRALPEDRATSLRAVATRWRKSAGPDGGRTGGICSVESEPSTDQSLW